MLGLTFSPCLHQGSLGCFLPSGEGCVVRTKEGQKFLWQERNTGPRLSPAPGGPAGERLVTRGWEGSRPSLAPPAAGTAPNAECRSFHPGSPPPVTRAGLSHMRAQDRKVMEFMCWRNGTSNPRLPGSKSVPGSVPGWFPRSKHRPKGLTASQVHRLLPLRERHPSQLPPCHHLLGDSGGQGCPIGHTWQHANVPTTGRALVVQCVVVVML